MPRTPRRRGSRPDAGWPFAKNLVRARSCMSGCVKRNTTIRSTRVVRPSVNAKPRTPPTAR
ncbi:Uncharacterised protein [Mycobacteroides abscessus]|nr:Uncharacterised protein [Mycobacteroides abscessus]